MSESAGSGGPARPGRVVHITSDGLLEPLGYSQVARVALKLAARGIPHTLISLEKERDLRDSARVSALADELRAGGVEWRHEPYRTGGGARQYAENLAKMTGHALTACRNERVGLLQARGFLVAGAALAAKLRTGTPVVFDIRGFWVERRLGDPRYPRIAYHAARQLDALYYRASDAVVSLTELGVRQIRAGRFGHFAAKKPAICIPTCADYDDFVIGGPDRPSPVPSAVRDALAGKLVVGFIGSLSVDYEIAASLTLFRQLHERRPDARLLCLTGDEPLMRKHTARAGIPDEAIVCASARHDHMPSWLALVQWGLLLLVSDSAKDASMPTKLAEFFAAGVRPVHFGCNSEVGEWVRRAGSGLSLDDLGDAALRRAAERIADGGDLGSIEDARERTRDHFSLASGVARYEALFRRVGRSA